jgi:hypothetical protein
VDGVSTPELALHGSPAYLREARKAKWLSWGSLAYVAIEGIVAVIAGIVAGSIALIGFGLDSAGLSPDRRPRSQQGHRSPTRRGGDQRWQARTRR